MDVVTWVSAQQYYQNSIKDKDGMLLIENIKLKLEASPEFYQSLADVLNTGGRTLAFRELLSVFGDYWQRQHWDDQSYSHFEGVNAIDSGNLHIRENDIEEAISLHRKLHSYKFED